MGKSFHRRGRGYVSADYVTLSTEFVQAESKEEEAARLAKEEAERKAAEEAAKKAAEKAAKNSSSSSTTSGGTSTYNAPSGSDGAAVANFASQFAGNPYVAGGTSNKRSRLFRICNECVCTVWSIITTFFRSNERLRI